MPNKLMSNIFRKETMRNVITCSGYCAAAFVKNIINKYKKKIQFHTSTFDVDGDPNLVQKTRKRNWD